MTDTSKSGINSYRSGTGIKRGVTNTSAKENRRSDDEITVEQYLEKKCKEMIDEVQKKTKDLISQLRKEFVAGKKDIEQMMSSTLMSKSDKNVCILLKVLSGPHIGQKFRLASDKESGADAVFKLGRSTGKAFKEKGVSLYKDKEVSTTHARIEIRNGEIFYVDTKSTNGSQLNKAEIESQVPIRLKDGDVLGIGGSDVEVKITSDDIYDIENGDNFASV
jgi:hypothetical protein